jgi:hypothetical protein
MRERDLNSRQVKFVAAVARGKKYSVAYEEAGYVCNGKPGTVGRNARRLAQNAQVREAIREMRRQVLPAPDMLVLRQRALAVAIDLAETGKDEKSRLDVLQLAARELEKIRRLEEEARKPAGAKKERAEIIAELRSLYARALPKQAEEPVVESAEEERKLEEILAARDGEEGAPPAESGAEILEEIREVAPPEDVEVLEPSWPRVHYIEQVVSKPGEFPRRTVMRVVRTPSKPAGS